MRCRRALGTVVALALVVPSWIVVGAGTGSAEGETGGSTTQSVSAVSTIKPLRELAAESVPVPAVAAVAEGLGRTGTPSDGSTGSPDPVQQTAESPDAAPQELSDPLVNFQAQNGGNPPDTVGDVGPNHYVQMVNTTIAVYDKQGIQLMAPTQINTLWAGQATAQPACAAPSAGDPIVLYDQEVDRFMVSQFTDGDPSTNGLQAQADGTWGMCIAYSQTADPTGNWFLYQFNLPRSHDYMKYGVWPDGLYMSTFEGTTLGVYVFERTAMVSGSPARFIDGGNIGAGTGVNNRGNRILPADWDGVTEPPAGAPNYFVQSLDGAFDGAVDRLEVYEAAADFDAATPTLTFTLASTLPTAPFDTDVNCADTDGDGAFRNCIEQAGTTNRVDALANRLMHRLQYRNFITHESMVVSQAVDGDGANRAGIRWYELRKDDPADPWSIYQQGTYAPVDGIERWMPSAAMDSKGNIAVGYSASRGDPGGISPDIRYTGRRVEDPLGSLPEGEHVVPLAITNNSLPAGDRWGDYSSMNVDPVDDCTFWYTQMFIGAGQTRATQVSSFRFPSCANVNLQVEKDAPDQVAAGDELPYTIEVSNGGTDAATNVVVVDQLPPGVTFDAASSSPGCVEAPAGTLTCQLGTIAASQAKSLLIVVDVPSNYISSGGSPAATNTATASADQSDTNPGDNTDDATTTVVERADLAVTKLCQPDTVTPQTTSGRCRIFVDNFGPSDSRNVEIVDSLVSGAPFTVTGATVEPATSGACTVDAPGGLVPTTSKTVRCDLDTELADGRTTITVSIQATSGADVSDTATASSSTPDPASANNQARSNLSISPSADLKIDKEQTSPASGAVVAGQNLVYTVTVTNNGPSPATNVVVTDQLPAQVTFVDATASNGNCALDSSGSPLVCQLGNMEFLDQETITIEVAVPAETADGTVLTNGATVRSDVADPVNSDNVDQVTTTVQTVADLSLAKFAEDPPFVAGTTVTYRYELRNAGPSWSREVSLVDQLPSGTSFVSAFLSQGGSPVSAPLPCEKVAAGTNQWSCPLGDLAPTGAEPLEAIVNVFIKPDVPEGTALTNSARATSDTADPGGNGDSVTIPVSTVADLGVLKTSDFDTYSPSATIKYTIDVTNFGPSDSQNVVVIDNLPDTRQAIYRFDTANCAKSDLTLTCSLGTMPSGSTRSFNVYVTVKGSKGVVTNTASVASVDQLSPPIDDTADPISANNTSVRRVLIQGGIAKK